MMNYKSQRKCLQPLQNEPESFQCDYCERSFSMKRNLQSHIFTHTGEKPFSCPQCDRKYTTDRAMKQHLKSHVKLYFECTRCDQKYESHSSFRKHEATHKDMYHFCKLCLNTFTDKRSFIGHRCSFKCNHCSKWFKHFSSLLSHRENEHQSVVINEEHQSVVINEEHQPVSFSSAILKDSNHVKHLEVVEVDKEHKCRLCGKKFSDEISLVFHRNIHRDLDPCQCMVCGMKFPTEIIRTYHHMRQHSSGIDWQDLENGQKTFKEVYQLVFRTEGKNDISS